MTESSLVPEQPTIPAETVPTKAFGGSRLEAFNVRLLADVLASIPASEAEREAEAASNGAGPVSIAAGAALAAFKPADEIEGMLAAQAIAMHHAGMTCLKRAAIPQQPAEMASKLRRDGANLCRGMADILAALDRKRGKGNQHIRVERVVVHEGGQAVVGDVHARGRRGSDGD